MKKYTKKNFLGRKNNKKAIRKREIKVKKDL
jgi:hypothetical protein